MNITDKGSQIDSRRAKTDSRQSPINNFLHCWIKGVRLIRIKQIGKMIGTIKKCLDLIKKDNIQTSSTWNKEKTAKISSKLATTKTSIKSPDTTSSKGKDFLNTEKGFQWRLQKKEDQKMKNSTHRSFKVWNSRAREFNRDLSWFCMIEIQSSHFVDLTRTTAWIWN